jgi:RNA recognition motif-containing protein
VLQRHFGPFGKIYSIRVLHTRNVAFVRYVSRLNAEFAKEAMNEQSLDTNEVGNDFK